MIFLLFGLGGLIVAFWGFGLAWQFQDVRPALIGLSALLKTLWLFSLAFKEESPQQEETP